MNAIYIDTETGGLFPSIHALLSIGACCTMERFSFHGLITLESQPGKIVDPEAAKVNGYSCEKWEEKGAQPLGVVLREFLQWLAARKKECPEAVLVCHHLAFDKPFLAEATRICLTEKLPHRNDWRCSQVLFGELMDRGLIERGSTSLDRLKELSGFVGERPDEHNAMIDSMVTKHGHQWLLGLQELQPDRKMMETMGREIRELEELVLRAGNFFAGLECGSTGVKGDVMNAAVRIAGGRKAVLEKHRTFNSEQRTLNFYEWGINDFKKGGAVGHGGDVLYVGSWREHDAGESD